MLEVARLIGGAIARSDRVRAFAWLWLILALLANEKLPFTAQAFGPLPDGGFYMNIAQHVRDGDGLVTDLSLAHKGAPYLPYPTDMYPLWPLVYGYLARLFPLEPLGHWLPTVLYFATLVFAYLWGSRLVRSELLPRVLPGLNAGHLAVIMFGLNGELFRYTSYPYSEGLTYTVLTAALWRMNGLWGRVGVRSGLEIGVWLGLATLCRKQMFLMALAAFAVFGGALALSTGHRRAVAKMTAAAALTFGTIAGWHYAYMQSFVPDWTPSRFLRWDQNQHTDALTRLRTLRPAKSAWAFVQDRLPGFRVAFGTGKMSYTNQYYTFQYAALAAAPLAAWRVLRRRGAVLRDAFVEAWRPERLHLTFVLVFALGGFLSIHTMHMYPDGSWEWMFAARHALSSLFLFFLALVLLFRAAAFPWTAAAVFILATSVYLGVARIQDWTEPVEDDEPIRAPPISAWINEQRAAKGSLIVAMRYPQILVQFTPQVGYHWFHARTGYKDICAMTSRLGVDYVVAGPEPTSFTRGPFSKSFELVHTAGRAQVYAPKPDGECAKRPGAGERP